MLFNIFLIALSIFIFLFIFWKRLREDYLAEQIFSSGIFIILGILIGFLVSRQFFRPGWFWLSFLGSLLGLGLGIIKFNFKFFETFESLVVSIFPGVALIFLSDSVKNSSLISFLSFAVTMLLIGIFYYLDSHYREFSWYKSGRIGFSGLVIFAFFFLLRAAVASFFPFMLSFVGKFEIIFSGITAFILFLLIYNLSKS